MNALAPVFQFGDLYLLTAQIERIQFLDATTVEIRTRTDVHIIRGTAATELRSYLASRCQSFAV